MLDALIPILEQERIKPGPMIQAVCEDIAARHPGRVLALIYYGSSLRDMDNPDKMLDFYVIVDSYRKTHKNLIRALLNALIPPAVYYHEMLHEGDILTTCKYSILSIKAFERRCGPSAFLSVTWGRFSQPCVILFPHNDQIKNRILYARAKAVTHMAQETAPLMNSPAPALPFWARGFRESYQTELRPEKSGDRSLEIVSRYSERYENIMAVLYGTPNEDGAFHLPAASNSERRRCQRRWRLRRWLGKPMTAIRVLNSAMTFTGGLDYIQHKLKSHSGVSIDVTDAQRRHPILWSPVLAWKYWKQGAFR